jgi:hypothetical protein
MSSLMRSTYKAKVREFFRLPEHLNRVAGSRNSPPRELRGKFPLTQVQAPLPHINRLEPEDRGRFSIQLDGKTWQESRSVLNKDAGDE